MDLWGIVFLIIKYGGAGINHSSKNKWHVYKQLKKINMVKQSNLKYKPANYN